MAFIEFKDVKKICEETKVQPNGSIEASALVSTYSDKSLIFSISYFLSAFAYTFI